jgi:hypothetical protein
LYFHLGERLRPEEVPPLAEPDELRRILAVRDGVGVGEAVPSRAAGDVVVVELEVRVDAVVGAGLPGQLAVEAVAGLVVDGARTDRLQVALVALGAAKKNSLSLMIGPLSWAVKSTSLFVLLAWARFGFRAIWLCSTLLLARLLFV